MDRITSDTLEVFFQNLGKRIEGRVSFYLVGGSALLLLGSPRETIDVDYVIEPSSTEVEGLIKQLSNEMQLDLEPVPLDEFVPLPAEAGARHRLIGHYGQIDVYVFDPYSIALSKLDRGFDTDIDDILFLLHRAIITLPILEQVVRDALPRLRDFDMNSGDLIKHLQAVQDALQGHP